MTNGNKHFHDKKIIQLNHLAHESLKVFQVVFYLSEIIFFIYRSFSRDVISFPVAILVYNFRLRNTSVIGHNYHSH